jgi:hypothetical protein
MSIDEALTTFFWWNVLVAVSTGIMVVGIGGGGAIAKVKSCTVLIARRVARVARKDTR